MDALATLTRLGNGRTLEELAEALSATAAEVVATGQPGKVSLTLVVSNRGQGEVLVQVEEQVARTSPKRPPRGAIFYALDGELYREDPRQERLEFRTVESESGPIRTIDGREIVEREA